MIIHRIIFKVILKAVRQWVHLVWWIHGNLSVKQDTQSFLCFQWLIVTQQLWDNFRLGYRKGLFYGACLEKWELLHTEKVSFIGPIIRNGSYFMNRVYSGLPFCFMSFFITIYLDLSRCPSSVCLNFGWGLCLDLSRRDLRVSLIVQIGAIL